jgi:hypothetical protein
VPRPGGSNSTISYSFLWVKQCSPWTFFQKEDFKELIINVFVFRGDLNNVLDLEKQNNNSSNNSAILNNCYAPVLKTQQTEKASGRVRESTCLF